MISLGDIGRCEAVDYRATDTEDVAEQCACEGTRIEERDVLTGLLRWRIVCPYHRGESDDKGN